MSAGEDRVLAAVEELAAALLDVARAANPAANDGPVELISVAEFARRASIGRSTAFVQVAAGRVRSVRVGGRRLIPARELARIAEEAPPARAVRRTTKRPRRLVEELAVGAVEDRHHHGDRPPPR